jgi:hypothetical protein
MSEALSVQEEPELAESSRSPPSYTGVLWPAMWVCESPESDESDDTGEEWPGKWEASRPGGRLSESVRDPEQLREQLRAALPDPESDPAVRPALVQLVRDQGDLLVELLEGFGDRGELLEWMQELVINTLGQLSSEWYSRVASDAPTVSALLGRPWGESEGFSELRAREIRRGLLANDILPACHAALETFRWSAVERLEHLDDENEDDPPEPVDLERQAFPAMRPELGQLDEQQRETLAALLEGFGDTEELLIWCHQLQGASYAEITPEAATTPYFERPLRQYLVGSRTDARARFVRRAWAAEYLLPAFNRASAALAERAAEVTATETLETTSGKPSIS